MRTLFVRCFFSVFLCAFVCVSAARADVDPKLVGYWLFKMSPVANWSVWHIPATGKTHVQVIGDEDTSMVLRTEGRTIRKQESKDDSDVMMYVMKGDDEVLLSSQGGLAMMIRIGEDRWNAMTAADAAASFPEFSDARFALLNDKKAVVGLLANLEPTMLGTWIYEGPGNGHGIWNFKDGGSVELKPFAVDQTLQLWAMRHDDSLAVVPDVAGSSAAFNLKYKFVTPDELVLSDKRGPTLLMRLANQRSEELFKLPPNELTKAPEFIKLADDYTKMTRRPAKTN